VFNSLSHLVLVVPGCVTIVLVN